MSRFFTKKTRTWGQIRAEREQVAFEAQRDEELYQSSREARVAQILADQERSEGREMEFEHESADPGPGLESREESEDERSARMAADDGALRCCAERDALRNYALFGSPTDRAPGGSHGSLIIHGWMAR